MDKICQWADVPFIPEEFDKIYEGHGRDAIGFYISMFRGKPYDTLDWKIYNDVYLTLKDENRVEDALPATRAALKRKLVQKWGQTYDDQELEYLENLH
jgi:chaperonin GroEL (HSP60 family)